MTEEYLVGRIKGLEKKNKILEDRAEILKETSKLFLERVGKLKAENEELERKCEESDLQLSDCKMTCARLTSFVINTLQFDLFETSEDGIINKSVVDREEIPDYIIKAFKAKKIQDDIRREKKDAGTKRDN